MGSDGFQNINKWKNATELIKNFKIFVYNRPGFLITETHDADFSIIDAPLLEISSTHIRKLIKEKKSIRYLVTDNVKEEIETKQYYQYRFLLNS